MRGRGTGVGASYKDGEVVTGRLLALVDPGTRLSERVMDFTGLIHGLSRIILRIRRAG